MSENKKCKFTRKELERLECNEEDIGLVLSCQKLLPILFENGDIVEFSVNAIDLWNQIGSKSHFYDWAKNNIVNSDNVDSSSYYEFYCKVTDWTPNKRTKLIDFDVVETTNILNCSSQSLSKNGIVKSYMLTLDSAKDIVMYIGALPRTNKETKEISKKYRRYFRVLEEIIQQNKEWIATRDPEKEEYKRMSESVNEWCFRIWNHKASKSEFAVEANGLNKIVTGKTSQELKIEYGCPTNELVRDYLKKDHNEELLFLERQNQVLLAMDMGFTERMNMLAKMHEVTFKKNVSQRVA